MMINEKPLLIGILSLLATDVLLPMKYIFTPILLILLSLTAYSQDRMFAYTYQSNVLNKGDFDFEFHNTLSTGKKGAYSHYIYGQHLDQRLEYEIGLGKNVQTAFYLNSELFNFADTASTDLNQEHKFSFSNEWKWKLLDPVANRFGLALYEEIEVGGSNWESETKLIIDKRWKRDILAFNAVKKYEIERVVRRQDNMTSSDWYRNSPVEFNLAYMHFLRPEIGIGMEMRENNAIDQDHGWINSVLFAGVAFHAQTGKFFINLTALPQLVNMHKTKAVPGNMDVDNFEKLEASALIGYSF